MDFKYRLGVSLVSALVISMIIYAVFSPIITWYFNSINGLFSCGSTMVTFCDITNMMLTVAVPLFAVFLAIAGIFEVFLK